MISIFLTRTSQNMTIKFLILTKIYCEAREKTKRKLVSPNVFTNSKESVLMLGTRDSALDKFALNLPVHNGGMYLNF